MAITVSESPSVEQFKSSWANMVEAIEPDVARLPQPWKTTFEGLLNLLMSNTLSLGIIPKKRMMAMHELHDWILNLNKYPDFVNYDLTWIASVVTKLFGMIEFSMSEEGKFLLEGPMSRQFMYQTSKVMQQGEVARSPRYIRRGGQPLE